MELSPEFRPKILDFGDRRDIGGMILVKNEIENMLDNFSLIFSLSLFKCKMCM